MTGRIWLDIPNCCTPAEGLCTGGRPRQSDLQEAKNRGVSMVINLCPAAEDPGYDEASFVRQLDMQYVNIPIAGPADLTRANAQRLADALADCTGGALVHCASGNRVGALFALKAHYIDGRPLEQAIADGKAHGLKASEPAVRQILGS